MGTLWQDIKYGARMLWQNRTVTLIAVLALALGIGANTTIFTVVNAVLLRPLPYPDPDTLVMVWGTHPQIGREEMSPPDFVDVREQQQSFSRLAGGLLRTFNLTGDGEPEQMIGAMATADLFSVLGLEPLAGRSFTADEDRPGGPNVVVLGYGNWQRRFGGSADVLGRVISLNGEPYEIVGVAPPALVFPTDAELYVPLALDATGFSRRANSLAVLGRLKPGVTLAQARADLHGIMERLEQEYPQSNTGWRAEPVRLHEQLVGDVRTPLLVLLGAVGFVLLIACANVANLLLARASSRQREMAIRSALGAGRWRLARLLLTESVVLAVLAGGAGLLLAAWGTELLVGAAPAQIPRLAGVGMDPTVLLFTLLLSVATGLVFGAVPAISGSRINLADALRAGGRGTTGGRHRLRKLLVVSEVALSLVLLAGAGLLIRSLYGLLYSDPGFDSSNLLTMRVVLPRSQYPTPAHWSEFHQQAAARMHALPGVVSTTTVTPMPLSGGVRYSSFAVEGRPPVDPGTVQDASTLFVGEGFLQTLRIPLLAGRGFDDFDRGARSVLINQTMARRYFAGEEPVGRRLTFGNPADPETDWWTIVGVVADMRHEPVESSVYPAIYRFQPTLGTNLVVRTEGRPLALVGPVRGVFRSLDPELPITSVRTMEEALAAALGDRRFAMWLLAIFAGLALLLASIGIYGVMSYSVTERTQEIGIRLALGADRGGILRLVIGQGMALAAVGLVLGIGAGLAGMLHGVSPSDPLIYISVAGLLAAVALAACWLPARRATRVDPVVALRHE
jgi:putative ABC transport system permease protein